MMIRLIVHYCGTSAVLRMKVLPYDVFDEYTRGNDTIINLGPFPLH